jgi:type II secretion system protein J
MRRAAFTLIELLIAMSIFAIVLAAINTVFFSAIRLRLKTSAVVDAELPVDRAVEILKRDFSGIVQTGIIAGAFCSDTTVQGLSQAVNLEIFTTTGVTSDAEPWGDIQKIDYWLQNPASNYGPGGRDLVRGVTRNLLSPSVLPPEPHVLLQGVQTLKFSYFDGTNWAETWNSANLWSNTPIALKLRVDFVKPRDGSIQNPAMQLMVPISIVAATTNSPQSQTTQ